MAKKKESKKEKKEQKRQVGRDKSASGEFIWAGVFLAASVAAYGWAAHTLLSVELVPVVTGLILFLALVCWASGGGLTEGRSFDQKNGVLGMSVALVLLVAAGPHMVPDASSTPSRSTGAKNWHPSMDQVLNKTQAPSPQPGAAPASSRFGKNLAELLSKPPVPESPPDESKLNKLADGARRFYWGYLRGDVSVMQNEASFDFAGKIEDMKLPKPVDVSLGELKVIECAYSNGSVIVKLSRNGTKPVTVRLTKDVTWEVSSFEPAS